MFGKINTFERDTLQTQFSFIRLSYVIISLLGSKRIQTERNVSVAFVLVFRVLSFYNDKHFRNTEKVFSLACFLEKKNKTKQKKNNFLSLCLFQWWERNIPGSHFVILVLPQMLVTWKARVALVSQFCNQQLINCVLLVKFSNFK